MRSIAALLYILLAGIAGRILSRHLGRSHRTLGALVISLVFLLFPVHLLGTLELGGWIGKIRFDALLFTEAGLFLAVWFVSRLLPPPVDPTPPARLPLPFYLKLSAWILAGSYLVFAFDLLTSFPTGWDALAYHFPVSLRLLQEGTLSLPLPRVWQLCLPANAEIGMAILLAAGYHALAPLLNALAVVVLAYALYIIVVQAGYDRMTAVATTLIAISIPMVQFQTFAGLIDLFGTACFLAAAALFLVRPSVGAGAGSIRRDLAAVALSGLACGISAGSKPIYYVYSAVFFLIAFLTLLVAYKKAGKTAGQVALVMLVLTAGVAAPSAFWFVRGMKAAGNPVYPLRVTIGNRVLFDGYRSEQITTMDDENNYVRSSRYEWFVYPWTEWKRGRSWDQMPYGTNSGYGAAFAAFIPLGVLYAAREFLKRRLGNSQAVIFLAFCLLLVMWWFFLRREPRFGLPLWVAACCLSAPLIQLLMRSNSRLFGALFVCAIASTCLITSSRPALGLASRLRSGPYSRADTYEYPKSIDQLPPGSRILNYSQSYMNNFALAGAGLGNLVVPFYALPAPAGGKLDVDAAFQSRSLTLDMVREYKADYIVEELDDPKASPPPPTPDLFLDSDTVIGSEKPTRWRIWRVPKQFDEPRLAVGR
jgi:hypothetical protein